MTIERSEMAIPSPSPSPGIILNLETTGVFLGILVSFSVLAGVAISIISKINAISFSIDKIQEALKVYASNTDKIKDLDKRLDIHLQDYVNHKDAILLERNGIRERIDHKWERTEQEFNEIRQEVKEIQGYLQKRDEFKVRQ